MRPAISDLKRIYPLVVALLACPACGSSGGETPLPAWSKEEEMAEIRDGYYGWAHALRQHNAALANQYCHPDGNAAGMVEVCTEQWQSNAELYYLLDSVDVWRPAYFDEQATEVLVRGNMEMHQGPSTPAFYFGFVSSVQVVNGTYFIDGVNTNHDPNWWR